jgi:hypothetical protein
VLTVDAGADQTVEDGQAVTLAGRAMDSSGATQSFAWRQAAGTSVTLANASSTSATFTAPETSGELRFELSVTVDGRTATDATVVQVRAAPILLIANNSGGSVVSFRKPAALEGNARPRSLLAGPNVRLSQPMDVVLDKRGSFLVNSPDTDRLSGFFNGMTRTGDITPDRVVVNPDARLNYPSALAYDATTDRLFVSNENGFGGAVTIYADASSPAFSGSIFPLRRFTSLGLRNPRALRFVGNDLYVANAGSWAVTVYDNAADLTGDVIPNRTISSPAVTTLGDVWIDAQDRLYSARSIMIFNGASSLNGESTPVSTIVLTGAMNPMGLAIDASGTGYVTDNARNALFVIENIAQRSGALTPDRTIEGADTGLAGPWHMRLIER